MAVNTPLVWMDLEMTGLNPDHPDGGDRIIEIASVITDNHLNILATGPVLAIFQPEDILLKMDSWNIKTHTGSGLLKRVRESLISEQEAEDLTLKFISQHVKKNQSPLCGNSIWQDRRFLAKYMPKLEQYLQVLPYNPYRPAWCGASAENKVLTSPVVALGAGFTGGRGLAAIVVSPDLD